MIELVFLSNKQKMQLLKYKNDCLEENKINVNLNEKTNNILEEKKRNILDEYRCNIV